MGQPKSVGQVYGEKKGWAKFRKKKLKKLNLCEWLVLFCNVENHYKYNVFLL